MSLEPKGGDEISLSPGLEKASGLCREIDATHIISDKDAGKYVESRCVGTQRSLPNMSDAAIASSTTPLPLAAFS